MGNARLELSQGPIILVGPRGAVRAARLPIARPASRGRRGLAVFWGVVLLGAALGAAALQALGPPRQQTAPLAGIAPGQADAPAPTAPGSTAALTPDPFPPAQTLRPPSQRLDADAFIAIPTPEVLPVPPLPAVVPRVAAVQTGTPNATVRRAVFHYRAGSAPDDAERLAGRARAITGRIELRAVPATPSRPGIRYFFTEDAGAAEALAAALAGAGFGAFSVRGFPDYRPSPQPGTIEVWLP